MFKVVILILCIATAAYGWTCSPYDGTTGVGYINVCKQYGKQDCLTVSSTRRTCINLIGGPFVSGYSGSTAYECKIYSSTGCSGTVNYVDRAGWSWFPFTAKSYSCPWKCS